VSFLCLQTPVFSSYFLVATATGLFAQTGVCTLHSCLVYPQILVFLNDLRYKVIGVIIRKSLRLSRRARLHHNAGQITNMISTDATRIEWFAAIGHACVISVIVTSRLLISALSLWTSPIQVCGTYCLLSFGTTLAMSLACVDCHWSGPSH
jgi:hypothetical protein